ncbi:unnamed protein product [Lymnaea stagnalis]|uniref:BAG family molecular chaperone regulator 1 n=1 Tax=Lymnaea stagnalis TaxID=6523 RepID=A0AAV2H429_LYMST
MASSRGDEVLDIVLVFGQKKIPVHLDVSNIGGGAEYLTVGHLSDVVYKETNIEPLCQRLIYRGKTLFKADDKAVADCLNERLSSFGVRNGDKIMLLGRKTSEKKIESPPKSESSEAHLRLQDLQADVERLCSQCDLSVRECQGPLDLDALRASKKGLILVHENAMKVLEQIDSLSSHNNEDFRKLRKSLVNTIQAKLDICEKQMAEVSEKIQALENNAHGSGS